MREVEGFIIPLVIFATVIPGIAHDVVVTTAALGIGALSIPAAVPHTVQTL